MSAKGCASWRVVLKDQPEDVATTDEGDEGEEGDLEATTAQDEDDEPISVPTQFLVKETIHTNSRGLLDFLALERTRPSVDEAINLPPDTSDTEKFYLRAEYIARRAILEREEEKKNQAK